MKLQLPYTRFLTPPHSSLPSQNYLIGLRGILVIQCFLFVFFQLFLPSAVVDSKNTTGPAYQILLRKTLSVIFWNESLIYSFIIFLSARTTCLHFLSATNRTVCASSIFRRGIRLWIPTSIALSFASLIFSKFDTTYITTFIAITENKSITPPLRLTSFLQFFNTLFDLFWVTKDYASQAANRVFPSDTLWIVSVLFQQSYTVYMTMVIVPYTRAQWRVKALLTFIVTAWWVQSWACYSISGLLLADAVLNMEFKAKAAAGLRVTRRLRISIWAVYGMLIVVGVLLQYLFVAWRPEYRNQELKGHTGLYNSGSMNAGVDFTQPLARDDTYLVVVGVMGMVETYEWLKLCLRNGVLVGLGRRSFSIFLIQPLILYTAGIKLFLYLHDQGYSYEMVTFVCFITSVPLVGLVSELFYRVVDVPSIRIAKEAFDWITK